MRNFVLIILSPQRGCRGGKLIKSLVPLLRLYFAQQSKRKCKVSHHHDIFDCNRSTWNFIFISILLLSSKKKEDTTCLQPCCLIPQESYIGQSATLKRDLSGKSLKFLRRSPSTWCPRRWLRRRWREGTKLPTQAQGMARQPQPSLPGHRELWHQHV